MHIYIHLLSTARAQLIFCKDNASERKENLFPISRAQLIFCKGMECFLQCGCKIARGSVFHGRRHRRRYSVGVHPAKRVKRRRKPVSQLKPSVADISPTGRSVPMSICLATAMRRMAT